MKGSLDITLYWLCFQIQPLDQSHRERFEKSFIKWRGIRTSHNAETFSHSGDAKSIEDLVSQLKSYFGSDLMDLNNECFVTIANDAKDSLEKGNQMGTGKYCIHQPLSFEEKCELGILLNEIEPS